MKHEPENLILANDEPPVSGTDKGVGSVPWLGGLEATCEDCMALMARYPDKYFDLAIVDPPYGIDINSSGRLGHYGGKGKTWDAQIPSATYFDELRRVARHQIIWGGNYFPLPPSRCFLIWDKQQPEGVSFADSEFAWTSFDASAKTFRMRPQNADPERIHPTQKPVALYRWMLENYAKPGMKLLDTHLGSGSHAIAAHYFGAHLTACEIDPDYYAAAMARIQRETAQMTLFA
jgi:site-specific DNA-methyltransferase (adenine-specific)